MNWEAIGAIGELVGSTAVLVTLGYLAAQVRYTRCQLESQEVTDYMREVNSAYDPIYSATPRSLALDWKRPPSSMRTMRSSSIC